MKNRFTFLLIMLLATKYVFSQGSLWSNSSNKSTSSKVAESETVQLFLDEHSLRARLDQATFEVDIPSPNYTFETFTVSEASIMESGLQKRYPTIRTFKGVNAGGETLRMDLTPKGFHAIAFTKQGTIYIDPVDSEDDEYVSYYRADYKKGKNKSFEEKWEGLTVKSLQNNVLKRRTRARANGTQLKSYRIAVAADNGYTNFHGGTVEDALSAIVTTMNRVTGIYENELAITFVLVDDNDAIIYPDVSTDPYDGLGTQQALNVNQSNLDDVIGTANYDIGHVFTLGSGGLAGLGVVCDAGSKARGTTGINEPIGDPFDVDFVAHEIGHQFGANHTFNGTLGSCTGGNRNGSTAYEPGSGSTIMAYAGICGADNIQNNSDAYFHAASIEEILAYVSDSDGASCPTVIETGNTPPEVAAPTGGFTIPANTPFFLTASGSDVDGDELTYAWEQYDLGTAGSPSDPASTAPLFRSFAPVESPTRYFPSLGDVVGNSSTFGETLPDVSRELNFKVTVRDNNPSGGGVNDDDVGFSVSDAFGPFVVTSQDEAETFSGGSSQLVTWDVANTNEAPINADSVRVLFSLDGGASFSDTLVQSTLNDGSVYVTLPNQDVSAARLMVAAVENVFFHVNEADFSIEETIEAAFDLIVSEVPGRTCEGQFDLIIEAVAINDFTGQINLSFLSDDMVSFSASTSTITSNETVLLTITNEEGLGEKSIVISGTSGALISELTVGVSFLGDLVEEPTLVFPQEDGMDITLGPEFVWNKLDGATTYNFTLATDPDFANIVDESASQSDTTYSLSNDLEVNTNYYWKVRAFNECSEESVVTQQGFTTGDLSERGFESEDVPVSILDLATVTSLITIPEDITIWNVNVESLDISHTYVSDMTITLTSPEGTEVTLFDQSCDDDDNIFLTFDDNASTELLCPPNNGGTYSPIEVLSSFRGESSQGEWILSIQDAQALDEGTLNGWNVVIFTEDTFGPTPNAPSDLVATSDGSVEVFLNWVDNSDDESGFQIERSVDGETFVEIGTVAADVTSYADSMVEEDEYFYRVLAFNVAGDSEPSNIASLTVLGFIEMPKVIYPNPAKNAVIISEGVRFDEVRIMDLLGKTVIVWDGSRLIDISAIRSGVYIMTIIDGTNQSTIKLIKE